jgi:hypothetical protein
MRLLRLSFEKNRPPSKKGLVILAKLWRKKGNDLLGYSPFAPYPFEGRYSCFVRGVLVRVHYLSLKYA